VPLHAEGASDRTRNARLRIELVPSSHFQAIVAKIERNYIRAFDSVPFLQYVGNSLLLVGLTVVGSLFSSAFVAYAFARLAWPGRGVALALLLSTMMVPPQVTMVPSFLIWRGLGWYNTLNPLWVPAWFGNAFFIFLMIQHMRTIPKELEEAARIDGLGVVQTWWYIIVPQLKPSLAAIAVMSFLGAWNEFMGPLIYLRDQSKFPLSLGLFGMRIDHGTDWSMLMAANVLMTLPSVIAFFRFQRHLIEGITVTGMKG
jgi:multiple sugar transport system permease protein